VVWTEACAHDVFGPNVKHKVAVVEWTTFNLWTTGRAGQSQQRIVHSCGRSSNKHVPGCVMATHTQHCRCVPASPLRLAVPSCSGPRGCKHDLESLFLQAILVALQHLGGERAAMPAVQQ
jgi:hypothetical protein